ncbi:FHA domain-containing protein DDL isoform X2 [Drosophila subobscura]|uniref:FHA domain-containing protein DDL isoform X2 n=1 Tax=Drosophila subobscura TaxID=7241 RepID=UPI00155AE850|nr:FHA domain-containing protein DDL isoform X2 [Drosophila subobscura]
MGKKRSTPSDQKENSGSSDEDTKVSEKNATEPETRKRKESRYSSSSSSSSRSNSNNDVSNSSAGKPQKLTKKASRSTEGAEEIHEKRIRNQTDPNSQKVHEQRSKWDSPDRGNGGQRHNSHRNIKQRRHSRSCSREREGDRQIERERHRESDNRDNHMRRDRSRRDQRKRSPVQRQRARSNERRERPRRSPERRTERRSRSPRDRPNRDGRDFVRRKEQRRDNRGRGDDEHFEWGRKGDEKEQPDEEPVEKEKPNFGLSGALTEDTNKVNGVVVKYSEPVEARKPKRRWRLYPFKGETALPTLHIHRQSCFLVGRDRKVVDLAVDHPSCSKQHAALQYRLVPFEREDGSQGKRVRLYLIDLESANGTFLNNKKIDGRKYYELMEKDVIKFGFSSREYVLLHENSKEDQEDDDVHIKEERVDVLAEEVNP